MTYIEATELVCDERRQRRTSEFYSGKCEVVLSLCLYVCAYTLYVSSYYGDEFNQNS
jgi:hypothetical protein